MVSRTRVLRYIMFQKITHRHIYLLAALWMIFLYGHTLREGELEKEGGGGQIGDPMGEGYIQIFPPHRKVSPAEAYNALKDVRYQVLRDYLGKDLPPWLDPEVNGSQPGLGNILEGRQVRRAVIATTWRSGSTFLGDLLNSYPGAFYHFEPFHYIIVQDSVPRQMEAMATGLLSTLLTCKYDDRTQPYLHHITSGRNHFLLGKNFRMAKLCSNGRAFCLESNIVATACAMHPFNFAKTVRLRLSALKPLLQDPSLDLRVINLVRDPRGVMSSRSRMPWCKGPTCKDIPAVCQAANQDAQSAKEYRAKFPKNFLIVRYEDLALHPYKVTREIFEFLNLPLVTDLAVFIEDHTSQQAQKTESGDSYTYAALFSTYRNSSAAATLWRKTISFGKVKEIQDHCGLAMRYFGYRTFLTAKDLNNTAIPVIEAAPGRTFGKRAKGY
ncbi:carbohydrate sulfotransferase 5-like [Palaemon carinicauda]|uniref:carbohydrate sulfotransferase 5-like n=1 Tax=Palaemon carinicauda TaxID=392227 RepID=UPI0035B5D1AC